MIAQGPSSFSLFSQRFVSGKKKRLRQSIDDILKVFNVFETILKGKKRLRKSIGELLNMIFSCLFLKIEMSMYVLTFSEGTKRLRQNIYELVVCFNDALMMF